MTKIKRFTASHCKKLSALLLSVFILLSASTPAYAAGGIDGSPIVTGTEKLIGDVTTWLMVLAPVIAGLLIIYFCIRRSAADEMDQKKWNTRIMAAIVSCIGAILGSATLNLIIGYYK
jgi:ABC-type molybdate transport system permease subunit